MIRELLHTLTGGILKEFYFKEVEFYPSPSKKLRSHISFPCAIILNAADDSDVLLLPLLIDNLRPRDPVFAPILKRLEERNLSILNTHPHLKTTHDLLAFLFQELLLQHHGGEMMQEGLANIVRNLYSSKKSDLVQYLRYFKEHYDKKKIFFFFGKELNFPDTELNSASRYLQAFNREFPNMKYIQFTLTYDYLFSEGLKVHVGQSDSFKISNQKSASRITGMMKLKRSRGITLTAGNLFSFVLFCPELKEGTSRQFLFYKMSRFANHIYREQICNVATECLEMSYDDLFAEMLYNAKESGYLSFDKSSKKYKATDKLVIPPDISEIPPLKLREENIYLYHYLQVHIFSKRFQVIWNEMEIYD